jgi:Mg2+ and Co2+ transporter CorA
MKVYSYNNNNYDINIIEKLIFTNVKEYVKNDTTYYLINLPKYTSDYSDYKNNKYLNVLKGSKYENIVIPDLFIHKIIIIIENNEINLISYQEINFNEFYLYINFILVEIKNNVHILNNLLIVLNKIQNSNNYFKLYDIIKQLDLISSHILYFNNFINTINYLINKLDNKNEKNTILKTQILNINDEISLLKFYYDNTKTTSLQKISHYEANISKILTYVATIFLPLSFIIALFTLPFKNVPLQNKNGGFLIILIMLIFVALVTIIYLMFFNNITIF